MLFSPHPSTTKRTTQCQQLSIDVCRVTCSSQYRIRHIWALVDEDLILEPDQDTDEEGLLKNQI